MAPLGAVDAASRMLPRQLPARRVLLVALAGSVALAARPQDAEGHEQAAHPQEAAKPHLAATLQQVHGRQLEIEFKPGKIGIAADWKTGVVSKVDAGGQGETQGVRPGFVFSKVNGRRYRKDVLDSCVAGTQPYTVVFDTQGRVASPSSFLQTGDWPFTGGGYIGYPQYPMMQAMPAQYGPSVDGYNLNPGLPPALQAQAAALSAWQPMDQATVGGGMPLPQSLLQSGQQSGQQSYYGNTVGLGALNQNQFNYAAGQGVQADRHEGVDSFFSHMDKIQNDEDINRALNILRKNLGDGTGNGHLLQAEKEAVNAATEVDKGVKAWEDVKKQTLEAAPAMAQAVKASAAAIAIEHKNFIKQVHVHGKNALQKFDEGDTH